MKVLYMTNIPAPYRVDFFNKLAKKCDLKVLFEQKNNSIRNEEWYKNNQYNFEYFVLKKVYLKQLISILKMDFDVIIMANYASAPSAIARFYLKHKKKEYAISADGGFAEDKIIITKWIKTFFISSATYWLSTGKGTTQYLKYYGAEEKNIYNFHFTSLNKEEILNSPISYIEKKKIRKRLGYEYEKIFLSIGQLIYRKGYDIFLETIKDKNFDNTAFIIAGVGEKMVEYKKIVQDNQLKNVYFIGFKDKKEVLELYKMADVFFFPTRYDIWGLVINEAMAYGLPIISTNQALASLELLPKDYLYSPDDKEAFYQLLEKFSVKSVKELYKIGEENLNIIKNYHIEKMVEDHMKIFKEITKKTK